MLNDQYRQHFPITFREILKTLYIGFETLTHTKDFPIPSITFAYGHHLFADELQSFKKYLSYLRKHFEIISYSEATERVSSGLPIDKPYLCFSFDDGFKNNLRLAELFAQEGISALFFVNPEVVNNCYDSHYIRQHCTNKLSKKHPLDFMDWNDLEKLKMLNHEIGNHSLNHRCLTTLTFDELYEDLELSKAILDKKIGNITHFAFPYGRKQFFNDTIFNIAFKTGHLTVASGIRGIHTETINFSKTVIYRDLVIFNEPLYFFKFFYSRNLKK